MPTESPVTHNVDWVASSLYSARGFELRAPETAQIGDVQTAVKDEFRALYSRAASQDQAANLDALVAEKMILESGAEVEYTTEERAHSAMAGNASHCPDWVLEVEEREGKAYLKRKNGVSVRDENLPTPPLERVAKVTRKDADFAAKAQVMLDSASPDQPILLGVQHTGNHLVVTKTADGFFHIIESRGKRVVRTLFGVRAIKIDQEGQCARVKWDGFDYYIREAFPVQLPKVPDGMPLDYESVYENPGHAQYLLNDSGMGVRFGTHSEGNHADVMRLNADTWAVCRTVGGVEQPVETVKNLTLIGDLLEGVRPADGSRFEYMNAREAVAMTSLEERLHQ